MKKIVLILLILITTTQAQTVSLISAGNAQLEMFISGNANTTQKVFIPPNTERQEVIYPENITIKKDEYGNPIINVTGNYSYKFQITINSTKPRLTDQKLTEKQKNEYLEDSYLINTSLKEIQERSKNIIGNTESTLEAIARLTTWVNENIEYETTSKKMKNTKQILQTRTGVCSEYTTLYAALARASGIPTRIVTGMANTGSTWKRHAWAESLVDGKWIPVEPTYKEAGTRNALAVKLYAAPTYQLYLLPQNTEEIKITNWTTQEYDLKMNVTASISKEKIAPRETFYVHATITNWEDTWIMPSYIVQKHVGITLADEFRKIIVVPPRESRTIEWKFISPYGDRDEYVLFIKGPKIEKKFVIQVDTNKKAEEDTTTQITDVFARENQGNLLIDVKIENKGNTDSQTIVRTMTSGGTQQKNIDIEAGTKKTVSFQHKTLPGEQPYVVTITTQNQTKKVEGTIKIPLQAGAQQTLLNALNQNLYPIYLAIIALVILAIMISIIHPRIKKPKKLFEEKDAWHKLMNIKRP